MTEYMGYHPASLRTLRDAMRDAVDHLATIRSDDPAAAAALSKVRVQRGVVNEGWLPFIDSMITCGVLEGYVPAQLDGSDVRDAFLYGLQTDGWRLITDPLAATPHATTAADAKALAELLRDGDPRDLLDSEEELAWLAGQLDAIAADSALRAAFEAVLEPSSPVWLDLVFELGVLRLDNRADGTRVDRMFASVARLHPNWSETQPLLREMEPYSAALVLTHLDLEPDVLAAAAYEILERWWAESGGNHWLDEGQWADHTADILFRRLSVDPSAAAGFLLLTTEHPPMLFTTAHDQRNVELLLTAGTDPAHIEAAAAGQIVVPILRWLEVGASNLGIQGIGGPTAYELAAVMAAPWLVQFKSRARVWGWTEEEAHRMIDMIVLDSSALARLAGGLDSISSQLAHLELIDEDGAVDNQAMYEIAVTYWDVLVILRDREIEVGDDERFFFDVAIFVAEAYIQTLTLSPAKALAVEAGLPIVIDQMEAWGIIPPDREAVRADAHLTMEQRTMETAAALVLLGMRQLIENGLLAQEAVTSFSFDDPGSGCRPIEFHRQLHEHIIGLGLDKHSEGALVGMLNAFYNHGNGVLLCEME